jgi:pimeloyl-ACP methyl ester carboxylesterase
MPPTQPSRTKKAKTGQASTKPSAQPRPHSPSAFEKAAHDLRHSPSDFPNVSARWLLGAASITLLGALVCGWLALCILYWQGSWQLLYHPKAAITRTPASAGLAYEPIRFAVTETGIPQLSGWWMPNPSSRFTVLYLHGADGNLSDTVDTLSALHRAGLSVFAFDYRGYGQSRPGHPSETQLLQDADWALTWLTQTRHIPAGSIVVDGSALGANLAAELAATHGELAGVILDQPATDATATIFNDPRSRLVPARLLVRDRYDLAAAARSLRIPSLWIFAKSTVTPSTPFPAEYQAVPSAKAAVWLNAPAESDPDFAASMRRWLDGL